MEMEEELVTMVVDLDNKKTLDVCENKGETLMLHHRLYVIRRENRLNQKDMAKVLGVHPVTYHKKESGKNDFELKEAKILAKYFDVTLDDLFGD